MIERCFLVTTIGGSLRCDGECGTIQTTLNGVVTYGYYCAPYSQCDAFGLFHLYISFLVFEIFIHNRKIISELYNSCSKHTLDNNDYVKTCCCTNGPNCNIANLVMLCALQIESLKLKESINGYHFVLELHSTNATTRSASSRDFLLFRPPIYR